jgi:prophage regulatory protein
MMSRKSNNESHLMGVREVAALLDSSPQRADQLSNEPDFPAPTAVLASGRIWIRSEVEAWAREKGRLK